VILELMTMAGGSAAITNAAQVTDQGTAPEYFWEAENTGGLYTLGTAVLVTPARMLTAAHCVNGDQNIPFATSNFGLFPGAVIYFSRGAAVDTNNLTVFNKFTPDAQNHPDYTWVAWDKNTPMQFDNPLTTLDDLAVIPLDARVPSYEAVPATLPFDPDGTLHPCAGAFSGSFRGYAGYELTEATGSTDIATYYFPSGFGPYAERYSNDVSFFDFIPKLGHVLDLFAPGHHNLLEHGDSGGPLYQSAKLCGINSERWPFEADCVVDPLAIPPIQCHIYAENWHTRVDTADAETFLHPLLVDSQGNWIGTCGGKGEPHLQNIDTDNDLIPDACDPCPTVYDKRYHDTGVYTDYTDTDGDGIPDICDACPDTGVGDGDTGRVRTPSAGRSRTGRLPATCGCTISRRFAGTSYRSRARFRARCSLPPTFPTRAVSGLSIRPDSTRRERGSCATISRRTPSSGWASGCAPRSSIASSSPDPTKATCSSAVARGSPITSPAWCSSPVAER